MRVVIEHDLLLRKLDSEFLDTNKEINYSSKIL